MKSAELNSVKLFIFIIFISANALSEVYRLDSALNVRDSNINFVSTDDVVGHVSAGTEFKILSTKTLGSGAKALNIEILKKGSGSNLPANLDQSKSFYIYQNRKTEFKKTSTSITTEADAPCADGRCFKSDAQKQMSAQIAVKTAQDIVSAVETQASIPSSIQQQIKNYENSAEVAKTINSAMKNITRLTGSGKCYRKVKETLVAGGLLRSKPSDAYARNAANTLSDLGFSNLLESPYFLNYTPETAPTGSVLVYKSKIKCDRGSGRTMETGCGHTEIKLGSGSGTKGFKYSSDYKNETSILAGRAGSQYELIGVMIKPNL